ncbi:MAG: hypothetical protein EOO88_19440 [Pedobacter sp.]|nr:MAG: hypothetical protein EOO88_19440 [Pedobacter sp.]
MSHFDTVMVLAKFTECGEWGGHKEQSRIYRENDSLFFDYEKFKVNCDSAVQESYRYSQAFDRGLKRIYVNARKQGIIRNFIDEMIARNFVDEFAGHAGFVLKISTSSSHFNISNYPGDENLYQEFISLMIR